MDLFNAKNHTIKHINVLLPHLIQKVKEKGKKKHDSFVKLCFVQFKVGNEFVSNCIRKTREPQLNKACTYVMCSL